MANATFQQTNFTAGHISPLLYGRTDFSKFYNGLATIENFISTKHGPICRRPGTKYVAETKSSQAGTITKSRLIPFQFSTDQTYILEFGDSYVRFYLNRGRLQDDGTVVAVGADADSPFELGSPYFASFTPPSISNATHAAGASTSASVDAYSTATGIVTLTAATHGVVAGDVILVRDETAAAVEVEGSFPVLEISGNDVRYAKNEGGTTATAANLVVERPDLATLTFSSAHGIPVGAWINVTGMVPSDYNGLYRVERVTSTTLTYRLDGSPASPATTFGSASVRDVGVDKIDYTQSADVLFLAHENVRPKELQRKNGFNITAAQWNADSLGRATLTIGTAQKPHGFKANNPVLGVYSKVIVSGMNPSGYNGCYEVESVTDTTISYTISDPGAVVSFGTVDGWQIVNYENWDGPFLDQNTDDTNTLTVTDPNTDNIYPVKCDFALSTYSFSDLDRVIRDFQATSWNWGEIVWVVSATSARVIDRIRNPVTARRLDKSTADPRWRLGSWSHTLGWPRTVNFIQSRMMWGGNLAFPQTSWLTETNNIVDFQPSNHLKETEVVDSNGITFAIDDDRVNAIYWLSLSSHGMLIGTDSGEFLLQNRAKFDPLTPSNVVVSAQSFLGSKRYVKAVKASNTSVLFVQKAGRRIYEMIYNFDRDSLVPRDISQLSEDLMLPGVEELAFQREPNPIIWARLADGALLGCTYDPQEEVISWHKHTIGGTSSQVKSIAVISDTSGDDPTEQLWMIVSRTIGVATVEYVEYIEDPYETGDDLEDAKYVDSMFTYDSTATTSVTGLDHLEGETVKVFGDGVAQADKTVSSGAISIDSASVVQVGLSYTSKMATLPLEFRQAQPESNQKIKRMERAHVSFMNSQGVQFGISESDIENVEFDNTTALHTAVIQDMLLDSSYDRSQQLWLVNSGVFPTTIRAITIEAEVQPIQG